ncbi:MAG TPA: hypothetical protein VF754_07745, partial [Pyrinomonadaceae bacterium]
GRLDAKAHRKEGVFEVISIHFEPNVRASDELISDIAGAIRECAEWHKTPEVVVRRSEPKTLAARIATAVNR